MTAPDPQSGSEGVNMLPNELVETVLTLAWRTLNGDPEKHAVGSSCDGSNPTRWGFYRAITAVCRQWCSVMLHVRFRYVFIENHADISVYRRLITSHIYSQYDYSDVYRRKLFGPSHLRVVFANSRASHYDRVDPEGVLALIPEVRSLDVENRGCDIGDFISKYSSLKSLRVSMSRDDASRIFSRRVSPTRMLNVTHIHLNLCVASTPARLRFSIGRYYFPQLTHLRLSCAFALEEFTLPLDLEFLILELLPCCDVDWSHDISQWDIPAALSSGLLKNAPAVKILVDCSCSPDRIYGWEDAQDACQKHAVVLQCLSR